jgi:hypothetical protein
MEMDTWYDLRIEQLFDLTGRVHDLLDEVEDTDEDVALPESTAVPSH